MNFLRLFIELTLNLFAFDQWFNESSLISLFLWCNLIRNRLHRKLKCTEFSGVAISFLFYLSFITCVIRNLYLFRIVCVLGHIFHYFYPSKRRKKRKLITKGSVTRTYSVFFFFGKTSETDDCISFLAMPKINNNIDLTV